MTTQSKSEQKRLALQSLPARPNATGPNTAVGSATAVFEMITPERAAEYLGANLGNRRQRASVISRYAKEMTVGRWLTTHQGIAFGWDGRLLDGQHRLRAVVESGISVQMLVVRGIDPAAFTLIDHGAKRDAGDALEIYAGCPYPRYVAGVVRAAIARNRSMGGVPFAQMNDDAVIAFYKKHEEAVTRLIEAFGKRTPAGVVGAAVTCTIDRYASLDAVVDLGTRFRENDFQGKGCALYLLRRVVDEKHALPGDERYRFAVTAIGAALVGRALLILRPANRDWLENPSTKGRAGISQDARGVQ